MTVPEIHKYIDMFSDLKCKGSLTLNFAGDGETASVQGNSFNEKTLKLFLFNKNILSNKTEDLKC
jgi:hypothetical protein